MDKPIIDDELWKRIVHLLPQPKARREKYPGRKAVSDRAALNGIVFVLRSGLRWHDLPAEMGCGSGVTCWRRLRDGQQARVWGRLHELLLARSIFRESSSSHPMFARLGRAKNRATPRRSCATGIQTSCRHRCERGASPDHPHRANRHDVIKLLPLIDAIPAIRSIRGRPLQKPQVVYADRGYDSEPHRQRLRDRGINPILAKGRTVHGSGLGKYRCVVERTRAWFHNVHRLRIRYEQLATINEAFLKLAACMICWNTLQRSAQAF